MDTEAPEKPSRRSFFFFGALAAATTLIPRKSSAQTPPRPRRVRQPGQNPRTVAAGESVMASEAASPLGRLVRRVTMGVTPVEMDRAKTMGYQGYLQYQLNHTRIDNSAAESFVSLAYPDLAMSPAQLIGLDPGAVRNQLQESTIYRAAFSQWQLYERMVEFWSDHFNIDFDKVQYLKVIDDRDVIRKNALGKFPDLLKASAHSPAMMAYLDQNVSSNRAPNQNYAREIMELHTLGVDGGYTQDDVAELSRVLTGWTLTGQGSFNFNSAIHDTGNKVVLGTTIVGQSGAAGINEGEQVLDMLVKHPSTAKFIATKMIKWLLDPNPSDAQVSTIAAVYRTTGGDIKAMVRAILNDAWLPAAPLKFKRPFHLVASALRSANPTARVSMATMNGQLVALGHQSFTWDTPDGFPDKIEYWAGNILPRWNFGVTLSNLNSANSIQVDTTAYRSGTTANAIDLIDQNFFGGEMDPAERVLLLNYLNAGTFNDTRVRETMSLAMSINGFQWY